MSEPVRGFRFSIEKLGSGGFAQEAWKTFWSLINPTEIPGTTLRSATLIGAEGVYVIYVEGGDPSRLGMIADRFAGASRFLAVAAQPGVVAEVEGPTAEAGTVTPEGIFTGGSWAEAGLLQARNPAALPRPGPAWSGARGRGSLFTGRRWLVWVSAAVVVAIGGGATAFVMLRDNRSEISTKGLPSAGPTVSSTGGSESPSPTASPTPPAIETLDIKTAAGTLRIEKVKLSDKYMDCPPPSGQCKETTGPPYLIVQVRSSEGKRAETVRDEITIQSTDSFVVDSLGSRADFATVRTTSGSRSLELIYSELDSLAVVGLVLFWPDNQPINLHPA